MNRAIDILFPFWRATLEGWRTILKILAYVAILTLIAWVSLPAQGATDLGNGVCEQTDGQQGLWNGTTADDDGCVTPAEYEQMYSAENLKDVGVIEDYTVNDDGTTLLEFGEGISNIVPTNPFDRVIAVNPELEPDAPTVREVLESMGLTVE